MAFPFWAAGQGQLGTVWPQKAVHAALGGVAHGGGGFVQRCGQLGHGAAQQAADAVLNDKVVSGAATGGQPAYMASSRLMPKISFRVQVHKSVAGMIINVHLLVGQLRDQAAAVQ